MSASQTGSQLTAKDINRALAMLTNAHPHHAQLIRQHRSKIHRAVLNGDRFPELQSVPFPVKPTKPKTVSLEMKTDVKGPSPCLVAVGGVIASHAQLLLGLLGAVGVDVLQPAKEWLSNIAAPLIDYLKSTADAVLEAVSALEKSQKFALFISACVGGGLLGYIWDAISNWSWWEWIRAVASWTATILSWLGSGFVALIGKVVGIIINAFNLFESVQAMITQCGKPTNPGQAPATPNYAYWSTADIGQGSGFVNMQIADIDGDHKKEIVQFWNNHGNMAAIVYQWNGSALTTKWSTDNIGQGSGYVSMQCGDIDGDGKEEIIQFWNHGGSMGAIVYQWNGSALVTKWSTDNIGQGSGYVSMLTADVTGDGKKEILQFWSNHGNMGVIVYQWNGSALVTKWSTDNIGQGSGFVSMQVGDIDADRKQEIIQFWNSHGSMGAIVYQWNGSALVTKWSTDNIGQGAGFVSMLTGDIGGDGKKEIVQFWNNHGSMGAIVYQWNGSALATKWSTDNIGQGQGYVSMLTGDVFGHSYDELLQLWNNSGSLGFIMYEWTGTDLETAWYTENVGQGSGFVQMQIGDINGDGSDEVIQWWSNGGRMAAIVYAPGIFGKVVS